MAPTSGQGKPISSHEVLRRRGPSRRWRPPAVRASQFLATRFSAGAGPRADGAHQRWGGPISSHEVLAGAGSRADGAHQRWGGPISSHDVLAGAGPRADGAHQRWGGPISSHEVLAGAGSRADGRARPRSVAAARDRQPPGAARCGRSRSGAVGRCRAVEAPRRWKPPRSTHGQHTVNTRSTHGQHDGQHLAD